MSKADMQKDIRALRIQMAKLEQRCQEREDRMVYLYELAAPFFDIMTTAQKAELSKVFKDK